MDNSKHLLLQKKMRKNLHVIVIKGQQFYYEQPISPHGQWRCNRKTLVIPKMVDMTTEKRVRSFCSFLSLYFPLVWKKRCKSFAEVCGWDFWQYFSAPHRKGTVLQTKKNRSTFRLVYTCMPDGICKHCTHHKMIKVGSFFILSIACLPILTKRRQLTNNVNVHKTKKMLPYEGMVNNVRTHLFKYQRS